MSYIKVSDAGDRRCPEANNRTNAGGLLTLSSAGRALPATFVINRPTACKLVGDLQNTNDAGYNSRSSRAGETLAPLPLVALLKVCCHQQNTACNKAL